MRLKKRTWLVVSGLFWLGSGAMLLVKGLQLIIHASASGPLLKQLIRITGSLEQAALLLISAALLVGFVKGRSVLAKSVKKFSSNIKEGLSTIGEVYDRKFVAIILLMMGMGFVVRFLPIPHDIRGFVDVAVGSALIHGALAYFRETFTYGSYFRG